MQVNKQQLELDMEQQTWFHIRKGVHHAVYRHPAYLTYMQSTSCKTLGWMKHKMESGLPARRNISNLRYADDTTLMAESEGTKKPLDESESGE